MQNNIEAECCSGLPHIVVVGGGFAGLTLVKKLRRKHFRVTLIDKNNYHQFAPLFYQVATANIEASAISFPFRKELRTSVCSFVMGEVLSVNTDEKKVITTVGDVEYDYLVLAYGADTNYFGMESVEKHAYPMKSVSEAMTLNNHMLSLFEKATITDDEDEKRRMLTVAIVGGGPTGVEVSGALGELRTYSFHRDYPELKDIPLRVLLIEGTDKLLAAMSPKSSKKALTYLNELGVEVMFGKRVQAYDGQTVSFADGSSVDARTVIWASGIASKPMQGISKDSYGRAGRLVVDEYNKVKGYNNVFAIGDLAFQTTDEAYPNGHPQVAPVAVQQAENLMRNFVNMKRQQALIPFRYKNDGTMAIVGRNRAVVDLKHFRFQGFFAWLVWLLVHIFSIIGFKERILVFIDWGWSYFTNDASLRLIMKPKDFKKIELDE